MIESEEVIQFIINMAVILLPIIAGAAVNVWRKHAAAIEKRIEAEVGEKWWNLIETATVTLVNAAEQVSGIDTNEEKKAFVLSQLVSLTNLWNIPLSEAQLDAIIEGVYKSWIKDAQKWTAPIGEAI